MDAALVSRRHTFFLDADATPVTGPEAVTVVAFWQPDNKAAPVTIAAKTRAFILPSIRRARVSIHVLAIAPRPGTGVVAKRQ
jgi:hypothetical protein